MDDLNKRVLSVMDVKNLSKSAFAAMLEISLPVLTHIGSGRNKPGLEMIQKILIKFPDIDPDWLVLGKGSMFRVKIRAVNLDKELDVLNQIASKLPDFEQNAHQVTEYHALLLKEIMYLKELNPYLETIKRQAKGLNTEIQALKNQIELKVKD